METARTKENEDLLHQFFERQAILASGQTAVVCAGKQMTYGELEKQANQLARFLRGKQIGKGCAVALLLPRSADVYAAMLAVLKTGGAYVPLDPDYPADRISFILSDCGARALVTVSALAQKCGA